MTDDTAAIRHCIDRVAIAADRRGQGQLERRLAERLARSGCPRIAAQSAAAARRVGEWLATVKG
jgi:hypothetical protein